MAVAGSGIFFSSMAANPPSTFFSCAFSAVVVANIAVAERKARRESSTGWAEAVSSPEDVRDVFDLWRRV